MTHLEELTAEIREKLPRLMELENGLIIRSLIEDTSCIIDEGELFTVGKGDCSKFDEKSIEIGGYIYIINKDFEIVGKDPMLNNVLEWLYILFPESEYYINTAGEVCENILTRDYQEHYTTWDLSKLFLKDQSPELISFLHSLIKK